MQAAFLRVLYVEDNRVNALLFEEIVQANQAIELRVAEDGGQALCLAEKWPPDVLVLDAHLPDMNGYQLLARLRELKGLARAPAYMCSADTSAEDFARARRAGFAGYWTKPVNIAAVRGALDELARGQALA